MMAVNPSAIATIMVAVISVGLIAAPSVRDTPTRLIWNASASAPIGLYSIQPAIDLNVNDLVVVMPPEHMRSWLSERGYLASNVPLIKRIAAVQGQTVCLSGRSITIDSVAIASARSHDRQGRKLPVWRGCETLDRNAVFLLNWNAPDSLDGRYFGPTDRTAITGRLTPLWTAEWP